MPMCVRSCVSILGASELNSVKLQCPYLTHLEHPPIKVRTDVRRTDERNGYRKQTSFTNQTIHLFGKRPSLLSVLKRPGSLKDYVMFINSFSKILKIQML